MKILIYGAYGHTGQFVISSLLKIGYTPILSGRDSIKLASLSEQFPELQTITADINNPESLDSAVSMADITINCAGPYLDTAKPIILSALRQKKHYIDLSAEQKAVLDIYNDFSDKALDAGILIIPAVAFYGGLSDVLSTSITSNWDTIDEINIYIGLNFWHPTKGTRKTGERNHYKRFVLRDGQFVDFQRNGSIFWNFPEPIYRKEMIEVPLTEAVIMYKHLNVKNINNYLSKNSIEDISKEDTPEPVAVDERNRSAQQFCIEIIAQKDNLEKSIKAKGQDIYAVTAPLVAETVNFIFKGKCKKNSGVLSLGEAFDASDFLASLKNSGEITISDNKEG